MIAVFLIVFLIMCVIPFVLVFLPVFVAGLTIASRTIDEGGQPQFVQLFAGFKHRFGQLVLMGVIATVLSIAIPIAIIAVTGTEVFTDISSNSSPEVLVAAAQTVILALLIMLALTLPLVMATWFAPALAALHELGVWASMKASFVGCLKNMLPFLVYGLIALLALIPFVLALAVVWPAGITQAPLFALTLGNLFSLLAATALLVGMLALTATLAASIYTSYRDIYFAE